MPESQARELGSWNRQTFKKGCPARGHPTTEGGDRQEENLGVVGSPAEGGYTFQARSVRLTGQQRQQPVQAFAESVGLGDQAQDQVAVAGEIVEVAGVDEDAGFAEEVDG